MNAAQKKEKRKTENKYNHSLNIRARSRVLCEERGKTSIPDAHCECKMLLEIHTEKKNN